MNTYTLQTAARMLNLSVIKLNRLLRETHVFNKNNLPSRHYVDKHYFTLSTKYYRNHALNKHMPYTTVQVTEQGIEFCEAVIQHHQRIKSPVPKVVNVLQGMQP